MCWRYAAAFAIVARSSAQAAPQLPLPARAFAVSMGMSVAASSVLYSVQNAVESDC
jgi:hypothetical protein